MLPLTIALPTRRTINPCAFLRPGFILFLRTITFTSVRRRLTENSRFGVHIVIIVVIPSGVRSCRTKCKALAFWTCRAMLPRAFRCRPVFTKHLGAKVVACRPARRLATVVVIVVIFSAASRCPNSGSLRSYRDPSSYEVQCDLS